MAERPLLEVRGLCVEHARGAVALADVELALAPGAWLALVGASGSGKSSFVNAVLGLLPAGTRCRADVLRVGEHDLLQLPPAERRRVLGREIAAVFQDPLAALDPVRRVGADLVRAFALRGLGADAARESALALLRRVGFTDPERVLAAYPHELSGGMRQRVLIATALAPGPKLVLADEPTSALDPTVAREVLDVLASEARAAGAAVVLVTHDLSLAAERADEIAVLERGRLVERGRAADVVRQPVHACTRALVDARTRIELGRPAAPSSHVDPLLAALPAAAGRRATEIVRASGLAHTYRVRNGVFSSRSVPALRGVALALAAGERVAIVGESGSGKSTLVRTLAGLLVPSRGTLAWSVRGAQPVDLARATRRERRAVQRELGLVLQDPGASLDPRQRVRAILDEAPRVHGLARGGELERRTEELARRVGLPRETLARWPHELSGGERARVALARALSADARLLVLDEAFSMLDAVLQAELATLLEELAAAREVGWLLVTHDLALARRLATRTLVLQAGEIVEEGPSERICAEPRHPHTQALVRAQTLLTADARA